uniref:Penicillin acylase family protein n=1 Tax=Phenylobacterium glaciei TaxID=2803784 RepID=A0A974P504_9CAUL|nr:penicillin acylase family protein [Phenylobacterium glaciei]
MELRFTRHGPVLKTEGGKAFAIRTVWSQPGTSAYFGSTGYMQAQDWAGFKAALAGWGRLRESGLCRHLWPHRLGGGRHGPGAAQLGRADAGAGRRAL